MKLSRRQLRKLIVETINNSSRLREGSAPDFGHESRAANKAQDVLNHRGLKYTVKLVPMTASFNPLDDFDASTIGTLKKAGFWKDPLYYIETNSFDEADEVMDALEGFNTFYNSGGNEFLVRTVFLRD